MRQLSKFVAAVAACAALAGCGDSGPAADAGPPPEHGIFISASDCAEAGKLTIDQCGTAIDAAVAQHEAQAPAFASKAECEDANGAERCDKGVDARYRARLQAFFVIMSNPPRAVPLYPASHSLIGFISPSKQAIDARDQGLKVSAAALTIAYENSRLSTQTVDHSTGLGAAANDIH